MRACGRAPQARLTRKSPRSVARAPGLAERVQKQTTGIRGDLLTGNDQATEAIEAMPKHETGSFLGALRSPQKVQEHHQDLRSQVSHQVSKDGGATI